MKTLNKTLSLVLVLVMVLGLFGVAGAKEFTDSADVTYVEAVDVMTGIGAINGYTDGSIKPTATVTREEAAKLIAYAVLGKSVAENLGAGATGFTDVAADRWSAPFISYLVGEGIINGMGDGTFAPTANVTGYQFAKMMLCAAGYGTQKEYTGASWQLNVAVDANKLGVFDDAVNVDYTAPATREEAMLYAFNGIQVPQVTYNAVFGGYCAKGTVMGAADTGKTIAAEVYSTLLETKPTVKDTTTATYSYNGNDSFGNPAHVWTYKGEDIGTYAIDASYTFVGDKTDVDGVAEVAKTLKAYDGKYGTYTAGALTPNADEYKNGLVTRNNIANSAAIAALTGNGKEVNVYITNGYITRVVVIEETLAKVTYVDKAKETVTLVTERAVAGFSNVSPVTMTTSKGYGTVAANDYVVIAVVSTDDTTLEATDSVGYLAPATVVKGVATTKSTRDDTITVDGKAYKEADAVVSGYAVANFTVTNKSDATLYLDENGFVLKAVSGDSVVSDSLLAVTDVYTALDGKKTVTMVEGYNSKGEKVEMVYDNSGITDKATDAGMVYKYTEDSTNTGAYDFAAVTSWANSNTYKPEEAANTANPYAFNLAGQTLTTATKVVDPTYKTSSNGDTAAPYYFASDVKFIFADSSNDKVTVATGVQKVTNKEITYVLGSVGNTYQIVAAFVEAAPETSANDASDLVFVADTDGTVIGKDGKTHTSYLAVQNGAQVADCYGASGVVAGQWYTTSKDEETGVTTFSAYTSTSPLFTQSIARVIRTNDTGTIVTTGDNTLDIGSATIINLDKKTMATPAEIAAAVTASEQAGATKAPRIAAIFNEKNVASIVYYSETADFATLGTITAATGNGLTATITANKAAVAKGELVTYTVVITGTDSGSGSTVTLTLPNGLVVAGSGEAATATGSIVATGGAGTAAITIPISTACAANEVYQVVAIVGSTDYLTGATDGSVAIA